MKKNIKDFELHDLEKVLAAWNLPRFHAKQIFSWIYHKGAADFGAMSDLPAVLRDRLAGEFEIGSMELEESVLSSDKSEKFLFGTYDGGLIEAVSIPAEGRVTGCISSQVGCKFACRFCASGAFGFKRDLTSGEILDQVCGLRFGSKARKLTHIVFMGTGEPLDNYDNVLKAVRVINSPEGLNIGARRITISTSGIIPKIERLGKEGLQIELSVSLHAADDSLRSKLMPVNKKYPLKQLIAACRDYKKTTGRQVTFEYTLIDNINSSLSDAAELVKMIGGFGSKVNLIPVNPRGPGGFSAPDKKQIESFRAFIVKAGIPATVRKSRGQDIDAACGQLRAKHLKTGDIR